MSTEGLKEVEKQTKNEEDKEVAELHSTSADVEGETESNKAGEFFNSGLARWEQARENWLVQKSDTDSTSKAAVPLHVDEVIDIIFSPRWRNQGDDEGPPPRFPQNVPLPQMVDVLVDLWEAEGLDV